MTGKRFGLTATLAGIAAFGGAGALTAVLPAVGPIAVRPTLVADSTASAAVTPSTRYPLAERGGDDASVPGAGPFPHPTEPISAGILALAAAGEARGA